MVYSLILRRPLFENYFFVHTVILNSLCSLKITFVSETVLCISTLQIFSLLLIHIFEQADALFMSNNMFKALTNHSNSFSRFRHCSSHGSQQIAFCISEKIRTFEEETGHINESSKCCLTYCVCNNASSSWWLH